MDKIRQAKKRALIRKSLRITLVIIAILGILVAFGPLITNALNITPSRGSFFALFFTPETPDRFVKNRLGDISMSLLVSAIAFLSAMVLKRHGD